MCCFSSPPSAVASTSILSRVDGDRQFIAYEMQFSASKELAMILPIPVVPGCPEDSVDFISLEDYNTLFSDLHSWFNPRPRGGGRIAKSAAPPSTAPRLVVHSVGAFEASFVPTIADFIRLDPRFRIDARIWNTWPQYADYGFAVFKLKAGDDQQVHPMAFSFTTRDPSRSFFPTLHIHGEEATSYDFFDHDLYLQLPVAPSVKPPPPFSAEEMVKVEVDRQADLSESMENRVSELAVPPPFSQLRAPPPPPPPPSSTPPLTPPPPPTSPTPDAPSRLAKLDQSAADGGSAPLSRRRVGAIPDVRVPRKTRTVDRLVLAESRAPKWRGGRSPPTYAVKCGETGGVMAQSWPTYTIRILGTFSNRDLWVAAEPPLGSTAR